jgi:hypothetical protein
LRGALSPDPVQQPFGRHRPPGVHQQGGQHALLALVTHVDPAAAGTDLDVSQYDELHDIHIEGCTGPASAHCRSTDP